MRNVSPSRFTLCFYVFLSFLFLVESTSGLYNETHRLQKSTRFSRQAERCNGFKCTATGECLDGEKRCDGTVDCQDGSDEFNDCKTAVKCPGFLFTCDYGACIESSKKCDGKKDCRDNSDEANCVNRAEKVSSNCKSDEFQCISGQCIPQDSKCNGKPDCTDRSDEIKETCLNMQCPGFTFKCDYGACVDGFARCNNVKDCVDNSDEEDCGGGVTPPTPVTPTPTPIPDTPGSGCILPEHPDFGQWAIIGGASGNPSQRVGMSTSLEFGCNVGYKLSSENKYVLCLGQQWTTPVMPTCLKTCPPLYTTDVTTIRCFDERNIEIKCTEATQDATATFQCAPYFEPTDRLPTSRYCSNGTWNYPAPACQPVCGEKRVSAIELIVNGQVVQAGDYPWTTAIYQKHPDGSYENVCGGSMLTQKIILTAAHCVTNAYGNVLPTETIVIAVGKYYNKYKDARDTQSQYSTPSKVIVPLTYKGDSQRFASDIAVLVTKDILKLSKVVQPVCYQNIPNMHLTPSSIGVVTGWGYTIASGNPSEELREIAVPYKDESECFKELPPDWSQKYYTFDKMCAGHYNKSIAVCKGDSGGGLVFQQESRYYIHGVVSVGHSLQHNCNIQLSSLYTRVNKHYEWLERIIAQNSNF